MFAGGQVLAGPQSLDVRRRAGFGVAQSTDRSRRRAGFAAIVRVSASRDRRRADLALSNKELTTLSFSVKITVKGIEGTEETKAS